MLIDMKDKKIKIKAQQEGFHFFKGIINEP